MTLIPKYRLIVSGATLYFAIIFSGVYPSITL
jgi:hypothetical protein